MPPGSRFSGEGVTGWAVRYGIVTNIHLELKTTLCKIKSLLSLFVY